MSAGRELNLRLDSTLSSVEAAEIMVVYAGVEGLPVTVLKDGDPKLVAECF